MWARQLRADLTAAPDRAVWLQLMLAELPSAPPTAPCESDGGRALTEQAGRILIIDDQPSARAWARRALENTFHCFETGSVQEFFELALREHPDVILADLEMMPVSGLKLCRMVKANPALASVPFVLLTAHETAEEKLTSLADGADDHLPKSISPRELLGRVGAMVRLRRAMLHSANLEGLVEQRTSELRATTERLQEEVGRRERVEAELRLAQKLEAVGQLAAGVAHEINTPMQYIGDSVHFLNEAFSDVLRALSESQATLTDLEPADREQLTARLEAINTACDIPDLLTQVPKAFATTLQGVARVSSIVGAMNALVQPGQTEKAPADLHVAIRNALVVTRSIYDPVAEIETDFADLPPVMCHIGELNQAFLNLIVNAAHAVGEVVGETGGRGKIRVCTRRNADDVLVSVEDTGGGIPEAIRDRIFDPFFTTKPVGQGSGQGLAITHHIVVDKHGGRLHFASQVGRGTTFMLEIPIGGV